MEKMKRVYVNYAAIAELKKDGTDDNKPGYVYQVSNTWKIGYVGGEETLEELKEMSMHDLFIRIKSDEKYLWKCIKEQGGFMFYDEWIELDDHVRIAEQE